VAGFINTANPLRHVDVGSAIFGFVSHVASFRPIEVIDIRPLKISAHKNITAMQADATNLDERFFGICDSLSCLHALEHFGLGRYGDSIDPNGHLKGFMNLSNMLQPNGTLYLSLPIGKTEVHFNAHRIFDAHEVLKWSEGIFELVRFDYVDDQGDLHLNQDINKVPCMRYGCGIYTLHKIK
jgi:Caenorhabditis protein of unknown function, DUF268